MKNNRGVTLIEIIASLALISIIIIFLINLFLSVRLTYSNSKTKTEYEIINSTIIKAVAHDIEKYKLYDYTIDNCIGNECEPQNNSITLVYDEFREAKLNERKTKELKIEQKDNGTYYISYKYKVEPNKDASGNIIIDDKTGEPITYLTSSEKSENVYKQIPKVSSPPQLSVKKLSGTNYIEISIPLKDEKGNSYDIHIYAKKQEI